MKKAYTIRSDFADEIITKQVEESSYTHTEKSNAYIRSNQISIVKEENELGKPKGEYVSIECRDLMDHDAREHMIEAIEESLRQMCRCMRLNPQRILVAGLGNRDITSDALGPKVIAELLVTAHLYAHQETHHLKGTRNVAVLAPGVMGQTGMETFSIIKSVSDMFQPELVIAIDALATRNMARINRVIQLNNTGIQPGSGVGNHRLALNEETLRVPVIALGVATVVSIGAVVAEVLKREENKEELLQRIQEDNPLDMIVTPKSMDVELRHLCAVLSKGLNRFLHPGYENL